MGLSRDVARGGGGEGVSPYIMDRQENPPQISDHLTARFVRSIVGTSGKRPTASGVIVACVGSGGPRPRLPLPLAVAVPPQSMQPLS